MPPIEEAVAALRPQDADAAAYLAYHHRRYDYLLRRIHEVLQEQIPRPDRATRALDVGMSHQTTLIRKLFPDVDLVTLGYYDHRFPGDSSLPHIEYDLNRAADRSTWPAIGHFDLIVMAEVIEHLYVSPVRVLSMLRSFLRPGGTLILQTPNPVCLARRVSLLFGNSPFQIIREDTSNPGHFCEYTVEQLIQVGEASGFSVVDYSVRNYFGPWNLKRGLYALACAVLPGRLAEGITILLRRPYID
jgi:SAM-dependent methyltransferase